jgi:hypothetical protein
MQHAMHLGFTHVELGAGARAPFLWLLGYKRTGFFAVTSRTRLRPGDLMFLAGQTLHPGWPLRHLRLVLCTSARAICTAQCFDGALTFRA